MGPSVLTGSLLSCINPCSVLFLGWQIPILTCCLRFPASVTSALVTSAFRASLGYPRLSSTSSPPPSCISHSFLYFHSGHVLTTLCFLLFFHFRHDSILLQQNWSSWGQPPRANMFTHGVSKDRKRFWHDFPEGEFECFWNRGTQISDCKPDTGSRTWTPNCPQNKH